MKRLLYVFTSLIALSITTGCENEIDINAPWRETPVVYAFLDPNIDTQYLRIEKTYQNSINLTTEQGAKINDSLYFDTIFVRVKSSNQTVKFIKTTDIPKETGYFANATHYLYKAAMTVVAGTDYTLDIYSPKTGNTYLASTTAIGTSDLSAAAFRFPANNPQAAVIITVSPINGATEVTGTLRFNYLEYNSPIANADTLFVDYPISEPYAQSGSNYRYNITNRNLVNYIKDFIQEKAGYTRQIIGFDMFYIGGGKEISDMLNILKPSNMIVQKKLQYSNISGGLGIFSSRSNNFDLNIQNLPGSFWAVAKPDLIKLLNGEDPSGMTNTKNLNFTP